MEEENIQNINNYILGVSMLYNPILHGENDKNIYGHFLYLFEINELERLTEYQDYRYYRRSIIDYIRVNNATYFTHPFVRNYIKIITHKYSINPDIIKIIKIIDTDGYEIFCAIKKTFWLRLVQKTWKNIFKKRKETIKLRSMPKSIYYRETKGKWPNYCFHYPSLKGMMIN